MSPEEQSRLLNAMRALTLSKDAQDDPSVDQDTSNETDLEAMFLAPEHRFSDEWLNKLQQYSLILNSISNL